MKRQMLVLGVCVFALLLAASCSKNQSSPVSLNNSGESTGKVQVVLNLGKVGLDKTASTTPLNLDSATMDLTATGEVPIHAVIPISGHSQTVISQSFDLAPKPWSLNVRTYATRYYSSGMPGMPGVSGYPTVVHQGQTNFTVDKGTNPPVSMSINSQYSMLLLRISPVPDSSNQITLYSGDSLVRAYSVLADTTFPVKSIANSDTVKLIYNWLGVQNYSQYIQAAIKGIWNGTPMVLYWGNLLIPHVTAGMDTTYAFNLNWQGPSNNLAQQSFSISVGSVGLIVVDGKPTK
jgi:hypothetical protein